MSETPQPVEKGEMPAPNTGQEGASASPPPSPPPSGFGLSGGWPPPLASRGTQLKPGFAPGLIFIGLTAVVMGLGVLASSESSFAGFWLPALSVLAGMTIGLVWVVAFFVASQETRLTISRRAWARWASPPAIFFLAVALMLSGVPRAARFELSRGSLDHAAASAQAGNHVGSGWIGLIDVYDVRVVGDATFFDTSTPESGEGCAFVKFAGARRLNWSPDTAWNPHDFGGGWWYGCTGLSSD
jgi:hypothetical protein